MRSFVIRVFGAMLVASLLVSCGKETGDSDSDVATSSSQTIDIEEANSSVVSASSNVDWNEDNEYLVTIDLSDTNTTFKDITEDDFNLSFDVYTGEGIQSRATDTNDSDIASYAEQDEFSAPIIDSFKIDGWSIASVNGSKATFKFKINRFQIKSQSPNEPLFIPSIRIVSDKNVTTDDKTFSANVNINPINYTFSNITSQGFDKSTTKREVTLTLKEGQSFAPTLDKSMFAASLEGIEADVQRVSDREVTLTFDDMEKDLSIDYFNIIISKDAFKYDIFNQPSVSIKVSMPSVSVDNEDISFSNGELTLKVKYVEDFSGVENGISIDSSKLSIVSQEIDSDNHLYTLVLSGANTMNEFATILQDTNATVKIKNDTTTQSVNVPLELIRPYINVNIVAQPTEQHKIELDIRPVYGTFSDSLELEDFSIVELNGVELTSLKLIENDSSKLTLSFDTPDKVLSLYIKLNDESKFITKGDLKPASPIETRYSISAYDIENYKVLFVDDFVKGIGSSIGKNVGNYISSWIFDQLGIETEESKLGHKLDNLEKQISDIQDITKDISNQITDLSIAIDEGFGAIKDQLSKIRENEALDGIEEVMGKMDRIKFYAAALPMNRDIIRFEKVFSKDSDATEEQKSEAKEGFLKVFEKKVYSDVSGMNTDVIDLSFLINSSKIERYFTSLDMLYNFSSQTIKTKKDILQSLRYNYFRLSAYLYDYYKLTNVHGAADTLLAYMEKVDKTLAKYEKAVKELEDLEAANKTKLYLTGNIVRKNMIYYRVDGKSAFYGAISNYPKPKCYYESGQSINCDKTLILTMKNYEDMNTRAKRRGLNLVQDLTNAGFTGIRAYTTRAQALLNKNAVPAGNSYPEYLNHIERNSYFDNGGEKIWYFRTRKNPNKIYSRTNKEYSELLYNNFRNGSFRKVMEKCTMRYHWWWNLKPGRYGASPILETHYAKKEKVFNPNRSILSTVFFNSPEGREIKNTSTYIKNPLLALLYQDVFYITKKDGAAHSKKNECMMVAMYGAYDYIFHNTNDKDKYLKNRYFNSNYYLKNTKKFNIYDRTTLWLYDTLGGFVNLDLYQGRMMFRYRKIFPKVTRETFNDALSFQID